MCACVDVCLWTGGLGGALQGWKEWTDLPAPYKYYDVKVDPKDVESPGFLWNVFTNWRTGLPVATLLALPAFVYDVREPCESVDGVAREPCVTGVGNMRVDRVPWSEHGAYGLSVCLSGSQGVCA